ncbi:UDP-N-acetylglucosamine acyltransferase [Aeromonas encheleia]|uniref:Acyl-[acyl-carrier-protein]--UDP-N-acetylglucosamine O-acyltransferase n=1 Tax=Aeromonas encheleia TaxID=73010 RepID=A0AAE9MFB5_9GAMM|nr:acyl-ACP--UDP-N-acetylglucosamine O-acyltransferase [Aeromonas encheleia]MBV7414624.1 acyl-ACP--UDP-N-acetylglucosamine O-acyltransferase [Aeromonas sp. sif2433]MBV7435706.1 acyl-ACP--UDP-N-acetylglucosamine O-acyltransferase [Aeromonas sp. sif2416]MBV7597560.1 acyl-ACP--UDP-N-acetylglucosamine O-acyltransferase [Aeromonas sp. sia0103]USV56697.1 acyl-ACP--UDP-N-acetylglucosamine O-acyltransferase [Aeromonas encheleia]VEG97593.1 UDP-N-acetylglucosamine acyltransferase [Aeromonas encheleia]
MIDQTAIIHDTAIVHESAVIGKGVEIGPFSVIGAEVEIGDNTWVGSHVLIKGPTRIGRGNKIFQHSSIGEDCQDKKYAGERTFLEIGDNNVFRENCTVHRGTTQDQALTKVGSGNLFMVNVHVAHDCIIGDNCIFANNATLAGHVVIGDFVIFGGLSAIHQFGRVGSHAFVGGCAALNKDVPPYVMAAGNYAKPFGVNSEGLRRRGYSPEAISAVKRAYKEIFRSGKTIEEVLPVLIEMAQAEPAVQLYVDFLKDNERGIIRA